MPVSPVRASNTSELDRLRPYKFHGVDLDVRGSHAIGDCPFCGREGKLSVEVVSGLWRCFVCATGTERGGGNGLVFTRLLYDRSYSVNRPESSRTGPDVANGYRSALGPDNAATGLLGPFLATVAADRKPVSPSSVAAWGIVPAADKTWLIPGYGIDGRLDQVYRRVYMRENGREGKWRLLPTPGIWPEGKVHALHLPVGDFDPTRPRVDILEGPWDGMAFWDAVHPLDSNVVAVPGCNVWRDEWSELCRGRHVTLWFDSDHPRTHAGRVSKAGFDGMYRIARKLNSIAASVRWVRWGKDGYDPTRPDGWDVRDHFAEAKDVNKAVAELMAKVEPVPMDWFNPATPVSAPSLNGSTTRRTSVEVLSCHEWSKCEAAWTEAIRLRQDLKDAIAVVLAVCASTSQAGNQLFLDLIGSPGSAKTTICQGLLMSQHCVHLENMTKLVSGWKDPEDRNKDCSFLARSNNKTWITCEFDVLGSSPEYHQLMGKIRRIFDGETSTTYGNDDKDRVYTALRTPWIRAGTQKMMDRMFDYDQSQLGDRFLRFIIDDPENDERREITRRALRSERTAMLGSANGTTGSLVDEKTRIAQSLTGGYVDWLRANIEERLAEVDVSENAEDYCIDLAELSADMRARPSENRRKADSFTVKELPTRLARQNVRMASCLAVVFNKKTVDMEPMRIVRRIALDTAHGHTLNIVRWLCSPNPRADGKAYQESGGLMEGVLSTWTGMATERLVNYLVFLRKIGVLELRKISPTIGSWFLTERVHLLYLRVMRG